MKASDIMTRKVKTVSPDTRVGDVAKTMIERQVSGVPVIDKGRRVVGIVTEGDLLRRAELGTERRRSWWLELLTDESQQAADFVKSRGLKAADVMTRSVISVSPGADLREIVDIMEKSSIKRVTVVSGGKLVGIVSRHDLLRALSRAKAKPAAKTAKGDTAIRDYLRRQTERESWAATATVNFVVDKGKVELFGAVRSPAQREALRVMAESAPGVRAVKNRVTVMPAIPQAV
jgi:CBS-domain-containing membrane protein